MKEKLINLYQLISNSMLLILLCVTISESILLIVPGNAYVIASINLISVLMYLFTISNIPEQKRKRHYILLKINILLGMCDMANMFYSMLCGLSSKKPPFALYLMIIFTAAALGGFVLFGEHAKNIDTVMLNLNFKRLHKSIELKEELSIRICTDKDSNEPVIIPASDRFLHMLILGPTGCGKTSQMLIPMIWQDIQKCGKDTCGVTVMEPKGDLAEIVYAMGKSLGKKVYYFNPTFPDCPLFNPLYGKEERVIEDIATAFKMLAGSDTKQYYQDIADVVIRNSIKVVKRLEKYSTDPKTGISSFPATFLTLNTVIQNTDNAGRKMVLQFSALECSKDEQNENREIAAWFNNEYYNEKSKIYENSSGIRTQMTKITSNKYLRRVLNPENGISDIDFNKILENGEILAISTAQDELRDLTSYLGYFIILSYQSSVFRRPGTEDTRLPHYLYIDEFQKYSNPGFSDMLTQGRSYRVASHLATQGRSQMAMGSGKDGDNFVRLVSTNARNVIVFPGISADDAKYYEAEFGTKRETVVRYGESRQKSTLGSIFSPARPGTETTNYSEEDRPNHSYSDIIYRDPGEITYRTIDHMKVMPAGVGLIKYIDKSLNTEFKAIAAEYKQEQLGKRTLTESQTDNNNTVNIDSEEYVPQTNLTLEELDDLDDLM